MNLLHIDSSILGDVSVSRKLSADIVARLEECRARSRRHVSRSRSRTRAASDRQLSLRCAKTGPESIRRTCRADLAIGGTVLREFLAADTVVIGVGFYNFGIPSQLKAWIDRILVAGQTFRYSADGRVEGLCGGKRVILAIARGGFYGPGSPVEAFEHAETYLRTSFGFVGVTRIEVVAAEGIAIGPDQRQAAIANAGQQIAALAA